MSEAYDVIVIGTGIGGLSTGLHLADKGYRTLILEAHTLPGGLCTSFERQGYTFDTCIHWLVGCVEGGIIWHPLNRFGLLSDIKLKRLDRFATIRTPDNEVTVGDDLSEFERLLCRLSPADEKELVRFFRDARSLPKMLAPSREERRRHPLRSLGILLSYLPMLGLSLRYGKHSYETFLSRFKEGQRIRPYLTAFTDDSSVLLNFYLFPWVHRQDLYAPQVTSLQFSQAFASQFLKRGGEIRYRARVAKILMKGGKASGVRLEGGEEISARAVVSNADGYQTLFQLLGKEFLPAELIRFYEASPLFGSMLLVSLGVDAALPERDIPARMVSEWATTEAVGIGLRDLERAPLTYKIETLYNPAAAPSGKSVLLVEALADYQEWKALRQDLSKYKEAKHQAQEIAIRRAESYFPRIKGKVEAVDVATPVTFERYTFNREGSIQGWKPTPAMMRRMNLPWRPTSLPNLFMVGQWVSIGGGIPPSIMGGEKVADLVEKYLKRPGG